MLKLQVDYAKNVNSISQNRIIKLKNWVNKLRMYDKKKYPVLYFKFKSGTAYTQQYI